MTTVVTQFQRYGLVVVMWAGLLVVLAAAAVLSFVGLRDLAGSVRIPPDLTWLLPVAVDAGAAVSCAAWLSRRVNADAAWFARSMTWALLVTTVVGQAAHLGMRAHDVTPHWLVAVAVGAIPPAVVGACVHLAVLVARGTQHVTAEPEPVTRYVTRDETPAPVTPTPQKQLSQSPRAIKMRERRATKKAETNGAPVLASSNGQVTT